MGNRFTLLPLRLAYHYWKTTGDASIFSEEWIQAITNVLKTFKEQQRKDGVGPYKFQRKTERALDTLNNDGLGAPVKPVGLIVSCFRPSDDATTLQYLVPSISLPYLHCAKLLKSLRR